MTYNILPKKQISTLFVKKKKMTEFNYVVNSGSTYYKLFSSH